MDMRMKERIARALAERAGRYQEDWQLHVGDADAVLEVMMEPDAAMVQRRIDRYPSELRIREADLEVWRDMITAARSGA